MLTLALLGAISLFYRTQAANAMYLLTTLRTNQSEMSPLSAQELRIHVRNRGSHISSSSMKPCGSATRSNTHSSTRTNCALQASQSRTTRLIVTIVSPLSIPTYTSHSTLLEPQSSLNRPRPLSTNSTLVPISISHMTPTGIHTQCILHLPNVWRRK